MKNAANELPVDHYGSSEHPEGQPILRSYEGGRADKSRQEEQEGDEIITQGVQETSLKLDRHLTSLLKTDKSMDDLTGAQKNMMQYYCFVSNKERELRLRLEQTKQDVEAAEQKLIDGNLPPKYRKHFQGVAENAKAVHEKAEKAWKSVQKRLQQILKKNQVADLINSFDLDNQKSKEAVSARLDQDNLRKIKVLEDRLPVAMGRLSRATLTPINATAVTMATKGQTKQEVSPKLLNNIYLHNTRVLRSHQLHETIYALDERSIALSKTINELSPDDPEYSAHQKQLVIIEKALDKANKELVKTLTQGDRGYAKIIAKLEKTGLEMPKPDSKWQIKQYQQGALSLLNGLNKKLSAGDVSADKLIAQLEPVMTHLSLLQAFDAEKIEDPKEKEAAKALASTLATVEGALNNILDALETTEESNTGVFQRVRNFLRRPKVNKKAKIAMMTLAVISVNSGLITDAISDFFHHLGDLNLGNSDFGNAMGNVLHGFASSLSSVGDTAFGAETAILPDGTTAQVIQSGDKLANIADRLGVDDWGSLQVSEDGGKTWDIAASKDQYNIQPGWLVKVGTSATVADSARYEAIHNYHTETVRDDDYLSRMLKRMPEAKSLNDLEVSADGGATWTSYGNMKDPNYIKAGWLVRTETQPTFVQTSGTQGVDNEDKELYEMPDKLERSLSEGSSTVAREGEIEESLGTQPLGSNQTFVERSFSIVGERDKGDVTLGRQGFNAEGPGDEDIDPTATSGINRTFFNGKAQVNGSVEYLNGQAGPHLEGYVGGNHLAAGVEAGYTSDNYYVSPSAGYFSDKVQAALKGTFGVGQLDSGVILPDGEHKFETEHEKWEVGAHLGINVDGRLIRKIGATGGYGQTSDENGGKFSYRNANGDLSTYDVKVVGATEKFGKFGIESQKFGDFSLTAGVTHESITFDNPGAGYELATEGNDFTTPYGGIAFQRGPVKLAVEGGAQYVGASGEVSLDGKKLGVNFVDNDNQSQLTAALTADVSNRVSLTLKGGATNYKDKYIAEPENYFAQFGVTVNFGDVKTGAKKPQTISSAIQDLQGVLFTELGNVDPKPKATIAIKETREANQAPSMLIVGANRTIPGKAEEYVISATDPEGDPIVKYDFDIRDCSGFVGVAVADVKYPSNEPYKAIITFGSVNAGGATAVLRCTIADKYGHSATKELPITISEGQNPGNSNTTPTVKPGGDTDPGNGTDPSIGPGGDTDPGNDYTDPTTGSGGDTDPGNGTDPSIGPGGDTDPGDDYTDPGNTPSDPSDDQPTDPGFTPEDDDTGGEPTTPPFTPSE